MEANIMTGGEYDDRAFIRLEAKVDHILAILASMPDLERRVRAVEITQSGNIEAIADAQKDIERIEKKVETIGLGNGIAAVVAGLVGSFWRP